MLKRRTNSPADDGAIPSGAVPPRALAVRSMALRPLARTLLTLSALVLPVAAQAQQPISGKGFLFGRPDATLTIRGGFSRPSASSDVFSFTQKNLTLNRGDFSSASFSADLDVWITNRVALQASGGYSGHNVGSEFRNFIDNNDQPIEQKTELLRAPMTLGTRFYLTSPGRAVGRYAYIPSRVTPFVGVGGGAMWYRFKQSGDFVDYKTLAVFNTDLKSSGWAPTAYATAGFDLSIHPNLAISTEARYHLARATMSSDFNQFNKIDLSGLTASVGLSFRY